MSEETLEDLETEVPETPVEVPEPEPSLRDLISKAYDEQTAEPEAGDQPKGARDEKGRFAATQKVSDQLEEQGTEPPKTEIIPPPASWSSEEKERFKTLPPDTQKYIAERERQRDTFLTQKANKIAQDERRYAEIQEAIAPHEEAWAREGISTGQGIKQLIAAQAYLEKNPVAGLQWLAQSLGVDVRTLAQAPVQVDPQIQGLHGKVTELETRLAEKDRLAQQAQIASVQRELEAFSLETTETGQPKRPHLQLLAEDMVPIVARMRAENPGVSAREILSHAYDKAVWANPETRKALLEEMERKRLEDGKSKVQSAKRAGSSVVGAPNGSTMRAAPKNLREAIEASYDLLTSKQ